MGANVKRVVVRRNTVNASRWEFSVILNIANAMTVKIPKKN